MKVFKNKYNLILLNLVLCLLFSSCESKQSLDADFIYENLLGKVSIDEEFKPDSLGLVISYIEEQSCGYDGLDKVYTYVDVKVYTYPVDGKDYVQKISILSSGKTKRGITLGMSLNDVLKAYPEAEYDSLYRVVRLGLDDLLLSFYVSDDNVVDDIEISLNNNMLGEPLFSDDKEDWIKYNAKKERANRVVNIILGDDEDGKQYVLTTDNAGKTYLNGLYIPSLEEPYEVLPQPLYIDLDDRLSQMIDNILMEIISEDMTDSQKVTAVCDWMWKNLSYMDNGSREFLKDEYSQIQEGALNCLTRNGGMCFEYASLFSCFMNRLDIPSIIVNGFGIAINKTRYYDHVWNMVYVDDTWVHVDGVYDDWNSKEMVLHK